MEHPVQQRNNYQPLIVLLIVAFLGSVAITWGIRGDWHHWMHFFMGFFLCQFAMFKLFDVDGFANGFQMYDIVAKRYREYAVAYPYIELVLGLAYLSFFLPILTYLVTVFIMGVGAIGVFYAMQRKLDIHCACMGTVLKVPLSTVTLTEDLGMGIMALIMLIYSL